MQKLLLMISALVFIGIMFLMQNSTMDSNKAKNVKKEIMGKQIILHKKNEDTKNLTDLDLQSNKELMKKKNSPVSKFEKIMTGNDEKNIEVANEIALKKELFSDLKTRMINEMESIPTCLENAIDKKEAIACSTKLKMINKEFELLIGVTNMERTVNNNNVDFIWDESTKDNMIRELDTSIVAMQNLLTCLQSADTDAEEKRCLTGE